MYARLVAILLMVAFPAVFVAAPQPGQPGSGSSGQPGRPAPGAGRLDARRDVDRGHAARDGRAVDGADKMTVTIRGNVVTFSGGAGGSGVTLAGGTSGTAGCGRCGSTSARTAWSG